MHARLNPMPQLERNRNAEPRVGEHSGSQELTSYSHRRHTTQYSIQDPHVFDKVIRLSNPQHRPMHITTVDDKSTHRDARIRMQTVESAAERPCQQRAIERDDGMHSCCTSS